MSVPMAYIGIIMIWSTTPLAIQWSSQEVGFLFGITARMVLSALLCLLLLVVLRIPFAWSREARMTYLASGLGIYGAMMCVYWGAQHISSGLVSVVYGLLPLVTTLLGAVWLREPLWQPYKILGIGLGVAGLTVIFSSGIALGSTNMLGVAAVLLSTVLHAVSMIWIKRIGANVNPLVLTSGGLWLAVPLYLLTWWLVDGNLPDSIPQRSALAITYLGIVGSVLGFVLFYYALKRVSAPVMALTTLITPVCALILGHLLNGEAVEDHVVAGAALILSGLMMHHWGATVLKFFKNRVLEKA